MTEARNERTDKASASSVPGFPAAPAPTSHGVTEPYEHLRLKGVEADQYTAQGFEMLSAGLSGAVNGGWQVSDADGGRGVRDFTEKGGLWRTRRSAARDFWVDGPIARGSE